MINEARVGSGCVLTLNLHAIIVCVCARNWRDGSWKGSLTMRALRAGNLSLFAIRN